MSTKYVYADPHFSHTNIIKYESRPFSNAEEMNKQIIKNHNSVITKRDKVFILGDFCLAGKEETAKIVKQLNGYKILVMGNHDRSRSISFWREIGFDEVSKYPIIVSNFFIFSHEPIGMTKFMPYINVHGHIHGNDLGSDKHFNVSMDVIGFKPIELEKLMISIL
jgi:calcineurin-like phosphoesterase family protein